MKYRITYTVSCDSTFYVDIDADNEKKQQINLVPDTGITMKKYLQTLLVQIQKQKIFK